MNKKKQQGCKTKSQKGEWKTYLGVPQLLLQSTAFIDDGHNDSVHVRNLGSIDILFYSQNDFPAKLSVKLILGLAFGLGEFALNACTVFESLLASHGLLNNMSFVERMPISSKKHIKINKDLTLPGIALAGTFAVNPTIIIVQVFPFKLGTVHQIEVTKLIIFNQLIIVVGAERFAQKQASSVLGVIERFANVLELQAVHQTLVQPVQTIYS